MDFFAAQDKARVNTRWLILWFALAVAGIIIVVYLALTFGMRTFYDPLNGLPPQWDAARFGLTALVVGTVVLGGSLYKSIQLAKGGGMLIAADLGGRYVSRGTDNLLEQQLLNVVEEIAIAANVTVPMVFILDQEKGINAFAAGAKPSDSIIAVTHGALERLTRDELQGVIAHEFSHILNGDMRLNLRLTGILFGILLLTLAGRFLARNAPRGGSFAMIPIIGGIALLAIGSIGLLFGKLIKAAVSRQREFLADASAVQFTRNPEGIAGALKRIAEYGSKIEHPNAEEASHMFFGDGLKLSWLLASHPPIEERIKRVSPLIRASLRSKPGQSTPMPHTGHPAASGFSGALAHDTPAVPPMPGDLLFARQLLERLPPTITRAVHQADKARTILFGALLSAEETTRIQQLNTLHENYDFQTRTDAHYYAEWLEKAGAALRLPVLDLALPTLKDEPQSAREKMLYTVDQLIKMEEHAALPKYILRALLQNTIMPVRRVLETIPPQSILKENTATLLTLLALAGSEDNEARRQAYAAATAQAPFDNPWPVFKEPETLAAQTFDHILSNLAATQPGFRKKLVNACAIAVQYDRHITPDEAELLRAISKALECPVAPSLLYASAVSADYPGLRHR